MNAPTVSAPAAITVSIPTFNRLTFLERAVRSVLSERRVPLRLSVFDNASTDETAAFMAGLCATDERVDYTRNETNIGGPANIIKGLSAVQTRYFVPLADDDYLLPDFLNDAFAIMEGDPELGATIFYTEARDEAGTLHETWPQSLDRLTLGKLQPEEHLREWMTHSHYAWSSILWRSSVLASIGPPYMHIGLPSDVDFQAQIFSRYPVCLVDRPGAVFTLHAGQASHTFDISHLESWVALLERLDRRVAEAGLYERDDYAALRALMWRRYRPVWNIRSKTPVAPRDLVRIASAAGFKLGDWALAFALADEVGTRERTSGKGRGSPFYLPSGDAPDAVHHVVENRQDLPMEVVRWFKFQIDKARALAAQLASANERGEALKAEADRRAGDVERLEREVEALRMQCETAEQRLVGLQRQPLVRWLDWLGLNRER